MSEAGGLGILNAAESALDAREHAEKWMHDPNAKNSIDMFADASGLWGGLNPIMAALSGGLKTGRKLDDATGMSDGIADDMTEAKDWMTDLTGSETLGWIAGGIGIIPATLAAPVKALGRGLGGGLGGIPIRGIQEDLENQQFLEQQRRTIDANEQARESQRQRKSMHADLQFKPADRVAPVNALPRNSVFNRPKVPDTSVFATPPNPFMSQY